MDLSGLDNPIGGLASGQTAQVRIDVYNSSGALVWTTGTLTMTPDQWQTYYPVSSDNGAPATWKLSVDGNVIGSGSVVAN